jgi:DNA modification methylase
MKGDFDFVFQSVQEYLAWCSVWAAECCRVLKPTGAFYANLNSTYWQDHFFCYGRLPTP